MTMTSSRDIHDSPPGYPEPVADAPAPARVRAFTISAWQVPEKGTLPWRARITETLPDGSGDVLTTCAGFDCHEAMNAARRTAYRFLEDEGEDVARAALNAEAVRPHEQPTAKK